MIEKEKLEKKPLYSKWKTDWIEEYVYTTDLMGDSLNLFCKECDCNQTFNCKHMVFDGVRISNHWNKETENVNGVLTLKYICALCQKFSRDFILKIEKGTEIEKIGQFPSIDISIPKEIKSFKKDEIEEIYRKGKILENQGYGIGAFAYYRRIVELCINDLIDEIKEIIPSEKKEEYEKVIENLKKEKIAQNRIDLIKDTVVDTTIGGNPLSNLYQLSSIGIHGLNDEKCLEYAESLRTLLIYVIDEIAREKNKKDGLKKAMDKIKKLIVDSK
jgi:hypothetical protein